MSRDRINWGAGLAAVVFAVISLLLLLFKGHMSKDTADTVGKFLVAVWAILPPAFFWYDWVYLCDGLSPPALDFAKHTHDLARNIWIGLLGVVAFGFFKLNI
jgi:hypothetical protein